MNQTTVHTPAGTISLVAVNGGIQLSTPYDAGLVSGLKALVPAHARSWAKPYWLIDVQYKNELKQLLDQHYGIDTPLPAAQAAAPHLRAMRVEYIGTCKERDHGGNERTAYGYAEGAWSVIFPERVLRSWFHAEEPAVQTRKSKTQTLYAVLGIGQGVIMQDIKQAYRRLARQWHPDVCHEPDAKERFQRINAAYAVLSDERKRRKYDAGLVLQATIATQLRVEEEHAWREARKQRIEFETEGYRSPLRCGMLLVECTRVLNRYNVQRIIEWRDITDVHGRILVVSWPMGAEHWEEAWV